MPFCSACGVEGDGDFCPRCGKPRALPHASEDQAIIHMRVIGERIAGERHAFPALLSFFIPGLGQMIKGQFLTGILIMIASVAFGFLCIVGVGFVMLPLLWVIQLYDAYVKPDAALSAEADRLAKLYGKR